MHRMRSGQGRLELQRPCGGRQDGVERDGQAAMHVEAAVALADAGQGAGEIRVELGGAAEHPSGQLVGGPDVLPQLLQPMEVKLVGLDVGRRWARHRLLLGQQQLDLQCRDDAPGDVVLDGENVADGPIVALRPDLAAGRALDQAGGDADAVAGATHAALQRIADPQPGAGLGRVARALVGAEGRLAGSDEQARDLRQLGDQILGDAVAEIVLGRRPRSC